MRESLDRAPQLDDEGMHGAHHPRFALEQLGSASPRVALLLHLHVARGHLQDSLEQHARALLEQRLEALGFEVRRPFRGWREFGESRTEIVGEHRETERAEEQPLVDGRLRDREASAARNVLHEGGVQRFSRRERQVRRLCNRLERAECRDGVPERSANIAVHDLGEAGVFDQGAHARPIESFHRQLDDEGRTHSCRAVGTHRPQCTPLARGTGTLAARPRVR